ncbi:hypothetical protein [Acidovorax sp. Root402]|uniref:hypothetical protein n=1 Tax=Acidovorax sp. Root402 TaxID=1736527 RepID=UPI0012E3A914|nr:hypothetical protein [Acidovorax sp. Root402]
MKKLAKATCIALAALFALNSSADEYSLPPVTVTDQGFYDFGVGGYSPPQQAGGGEPFPGYFTLVVGAERYIQASNVRCSATGELRNVTSQSPVLDRWMAAEQVYRRLKQFDSFWAFWGANNTPDKRGWFLVIYADGYSEQWAVITPLFSQVTPGSPMPNTMKPGNTPPGQIEPNTLCG